MKNIQKLYRYSPVILTSLGAIGVGITAILTAKSTIKAVHILDESSLNNKNKKEIIKTVWPCYIPSILSGAATIACIFGANALNKRQQATIASAYMLLDQTYREYRSKVKEILGEESEKKVETSIAEEKIKKANLSPIGENLLFYEPYYGQVFQRTMLEVQDAEYKLNQKFAVEGEASLNDFFEFLGLSKTDTGDTIGWSQENSYDFYNYVWIEFEHQLTKGEDGMEYYIINMPFPPTFGYSVPL